MHQITVTNEEDEPIGVLEQWDTDCWMYAEVGDLIFTEPQNLVHFEP